MLACNWQGAQNLFCASMDNEGFKVPKCFSEYNPMLNANLRSYFDRWRDMTDDTCQTYTSMYVKPTWSLDQKAPGKSIIPLKPVYNRELTQRVVKSSRARSRSAVNRRSELQSRPAWDSQHHLLFSRSNSLFHRNYREYFDLPKSTD